VYRNEPTLVAELANLHCFFAQKRLEIVQAARLERCAAQKVSDLATSLLSGL
jgi:hypothetical protein